MDRTRLYWLFFLGIVLSPLVLTDRIPCINTETCNCVINTSDKNEYWCGETKSQVIIEVHANSGVKVICNGFNDSAYLNTLKGIKTAPNLHRFSLKQCAVPDKSFDEIFKILDLKSVTELCVDLSHDAATGFKPFHFEKSGSLEILYLWNNNITDLPESIFADATNLTRLYLNGNRLHNLPAKIFEPLTKLQRLDLGFNNLSKLDNNAFQYVSNLTHLNLYKNRLDGIPKSVLGSLSNLVSLDLSNNNMTRLKAGIFDGLIVLSDLNLSYNKLSRLPDRLFANNRQLRFARLMAAFSSETSTLPGGLFAGQKLLRNVLLDSNNLTTLPKDLFDECASLTIVSLRNNSLQTLPTTLFDDTKNLEKLDLSINNLQYVDETMFSQLEKLTSLNLARNHLKEIGSNLFASLKSLSQLDLSRNQLVDFEAETFTDLKNLTQINLSHNNLTMERWPVVSPFNKCTKLQYLNLTHNLLTVVFEDWLTTMTKLNSLDMSYNKLDNLTAPDFMLTSANYPIRVNYANNPIKTINLFSLETQVESQCEVYPCTEASLKNRGLIEFNLENSPIKCDCGAFHLAKYFQKKMSPVVRKFVSLLPNGVKCDWPNELKNVSLKEVDLMELTCPLSHLSDVIRSEKESCPDKCSCYYRPVDGTVVVNCTASGKDKFPERVPIVGNSSVELLMAGNHLKSTDGLMKLSKEVAISRLSLSSNKLRNIDDLVLPRALKILELDNNELTYLNNRTLAQLKSVNLTSITLHKNPWDCNCDTKYLLNFIRDQYKRIPNYQNIQCKENGRSIISLTEDNLCSTSLIIILTCVSLAVFGLMSGTIMVLYYKHEHVIKAWMFAHPWFRWIVTEKEIDKDKLFDAFLSFSHKDIDFIDKTLIPKLENEEPKYKLCVHYRHFVLGEYIPNQIVKFVEQSRRTIIVLTPDFLESVWGQMEFRTAHLQAIKEGCARVIIIMLKDVTKHEKLDPELKAYITMNTYVKWGDPMFWEKLKYVLPHPQAYTKQRGSNVAPLSEAQLKKKQKLLHLEEIIKSKA